MHRPIYWIAGILFLACVGLSYLVVHQRTELGAITLAFGSKQQDEAKRIITLERELKQATNALAKAAGDASTSAAAAAGARSAGDANRGGPVVLHIGDILKDHPEYSGLYEKQIRRNVNRQYGDGLSRLNLSPAQLAQLKDLLVQKQLATIDAQGAAEDAGLQRGTPEYQAAIKQAGQDVESQIENILGPNAENQLLQMQVRSAFQTQVTFNYAPDFADAGAPLTPDQANGLAQAMADANYAGKDTSSRPANYNQPDPSTGLTPHEERVISNATSVLSPAQLDVLKADQLQDQQQSQLIQQYNPKGGPMMLLP